MGLVYLPIHDYKNIGGPTTFIHNLGKYFDDENIDYDSDDFSQSQSILFPISYSTKSLDIFRKQGRPIIQRLDGLPGFPWHNFRGLESFFSKMRYENTGLSLKHQLKYFLDMVQIGHIYKNYSDLVIFQSRYCRDLCFDMMGEIPKESYKIIHNGVHTDIFYPREAEKDWSCPEFIMTGRFRRNDMLLPVLDALDLIKDKYEFSLKIIGPIEQNNILEEANSRDYVKILGPMNRDEIAIELRNSQVYIFASLNAPCPNALLEAVSSGLPIVSYDYGSISELLSFSPDLIAETRPSKNPLIKLGKHLSADALASKLELSLNSFGKYKEIAMEHSKDFTFDKCGAEYLNAIKEQVHFNRRIN